jgi:hypothetical protein
MIEDVIARWHQHLRGELEGGLDTLLDNDVVFYSPIVYTPQRGKAITAQYLSAASVALPGEASSAPTASESKFHYTKEVISGSHAVLEFETSIEGKYVNGVDIITCNEKGLISEFRVMIRPLQAVNLVHRQMGEVLEKMKG